MRNPFRKRNTIERCSHRIVALGELLEEGEQEVHESLDRENRERFAMAARKALARHYYDPSECGIVIPESAWDELKPFLSNLEREYR